MVESLSVTRFDSQHNWWSRLQVTEKAPRFYSSKGFCCWRDNTSHDVTRLLLLTSWSGKKPHCDNTSHDSTRGRKFLTTPQRVGQQWCTTHQCTSGSTHQRVALHQWQSWSWWWQKLLLEVANRLFESSCCLSRRGKDVGCNKRRWGQELGGN